MLSEFEIIRRYFARPEFKPVWAKALLGIGDDCALLRVARGHELAVSTDMLVAGVHFDADLRPELLGHKALAVNLSDLAATGATPRWATMAIALPSADEAWLAAFASGFFALADRCEVELVGGDTTRGPLIVCLTVGGEVPAGSALRRDGAKPGDDVWVSGSLGDAALALAGRKGEIALSTEDAAALGMRLDQPTPRLALGCALRGVAHSAIDISDGLAADLGHILESSRCGASIDFETLPQSPAFANYRAHACAARCALAGGDDYELCFTAPPAKRSAISKLAQSLELPLARIGRIEAPPGLRVVDARGKPLAPGAGGYDHFR